MGEFEGAVAIITGGASGIGLATARAFAKEGAGVVIVDRDEARARDIDRELSATGTHHAIVVGDVRSDEVRKRGTDVATSLGWPVRFLVNCAASFLARGEDATQQDWDTSLGVNVTASALMASSVIPSIRGAGGGAIVNVASISGYIAQPNRWTYNATKGAILSLTRCQALDLAPDRIRVNSVSPGTIWTPELDRMSGGDRARWEPIFAPQPSVPTRDSKSKPAKCSTSFRRQPSICSDNSNLALECRFLHSSSVMARSARSRSWADRCCCPRSMARSSRSSKFMMLVHS